MRPLLNVAHLLPVRPVAGLRRHDVGTGYAAGLPVSFDQRRHVSRRPARILDGLSFRLPCPVALDDLARAWLAVIDRHGTLRTVFVRGADGELALAEVAIGPGGWVEHLRRSRARRSTTRCAIALDGACSSSARPAHRLCVLETATGPTIIVAADHS